jgi:hypothetical protein
MLWQLIFLENSLATSYSISLSTLSSLLHISSIVMSSSWSSGVEGSFNPPPYSEPGAGSSPDSEQVRLDQFRSIMERYEIGTFYASKLRQLEGYQIVVVCDDSGSMSSPVDVTNGNPYAAVRTRWDELKETVHIVAELAALLDRDGIDLYFLNRAPIKGLLPNPSGMSLLADRFSSPPRGFTPLTRALRTVLNDQKTILNEKKLLILIATDGLPTDERGNDDRAGFKRFLQYDRQPVDRIPTSILAVTDDDQTMEYLNSLDSQLTYFDVVDDFKSEREEILKAQGRNFHFTRGDWVTKALLGSIDESIGGLDGTKKGAGGGFCNIL